MATQVGFDPKDMLTCSWFSPSAVGFFPIRLTVVFFYETSAWFGLLEQTFLPRAEKIWFSLISMVSAVKVEFKRFKIVKFIDLWNTIIACFPWYFLFIFHFWIIASCLTFIIWKFPINQVFNRQIINGMHKLTLRLVTAVFGIRYLRSIITPTELKCQ